MLSLKLNTGCTESGFVLLFWFVLLFFQVWFENLSGYQLLSRMHCGSVLLFVMKGNPFFLK